MMAILGSRRALQRFNGDASSAVSTPSSWSVLLKGLYLC